MAIHSSNTAPEDKDCWQTPQWLFEALTLEFGFWLDAAANEQNALCSYFITPEQDALNSDWVSHGAIWCNPPYSNIKPWIIKAAEQYKKQNQPIVMLLPADKSTSWYSLALKTVDEIRTVIDGRINFVDPNTGKEKKGNSKGSMFLIWRPFVEPKAHGSHVSKNRLQEIGKSILGEEA
ncbi:phage N-6-adenine-methyltransferase [Providencia sneebia]|uniref:DNA N-6-adenine-methyltransferase from phage origin n=1 Tax=Providencia sneebia DSM 19967 TaxID=1141660 RepID=K8W6K8_9GAMM|nr:DNA N-6-adenine-methyltransferase from phage origin [Providencia sneebia DSM 19967]